jgi:hypothetical protein
MFVFIITTIGTPTRINYPETNKKVYNYTNLFKRFVSRERQLLLLSDRPQLSDGGGPVRTLSRGSSGPAVFGRQAPPDDDSPERCCCGGRSLSLRGLFKKEINRKQSIERIFNITDSGVSVPQFANCHPFRNFVLMMMVMLVVVMMVLVYHLYSVARLLLLVSIHHLMLL